MSALDSMRHHPALSDPSQSIEKESPLKGASNRSVQLAKSHLELAEKRYAEKPCAQTLLVLRSAQAHLKKMRFG